MLTDGLHFGLYGLLRGGGTDPETLTRRALRAEQAGFESLWVGDHLALPTEEGGRQPRLEVVVAVSYLAAVTTRVRLGFGVLVLPQRQPVLLAKQLSSLDVLSHGRLSVGIGVGYVEPELHALGVPMAERGARTDEYLAAMKTLWTQPDPSFEGRFVSFSGIQQQPWPIQRPHPPITVGGSSDAALRRAATAANGWYGVYLSVEETATTLTRLGKIIAESDRPAELGDLEITITPPGRIDRATARRYADLGVRRLVLQPGSDDGDDLDELIDTTGATMIGRR